MFANATGESLQRFFHLCPVGAAHHDHHVVIRAELGQVAFPALLRLSLLADEVVALRAVFEAGTEAIDGERGDEERDTEHEFWATCHGTDHPGQ